MQSSLEIGRPAGSRNADGRHSPGSITASKTGSSSTANQVSAVTGCSSSKPASSSTSERPSSCSMRRRQIDRRHFEVLADLLVANNHPSGANCDLSSSHLSACYSNGSCSGSSDLRSGSTRSALCDNCARSQSTSCRRSNCEPNKDNAADTDQSVYQVDYHVNSVHNHLSNHPHNHLNMICSVLPNHRHCPFGLSLSSVFSLLFVCLLMISLARCGERTYVQLAFESEENLPVNTLIGQIRVPDSLAGAHTQPPYLFMPVNGHQRGAACNADADLHIDQHTGDIRNAVQLDRERCSLYKFLAISLKGLSFQITITVLDTNDHRPFFAVPSVSIQLPENSRPNEVKRQLPSATDLDSPQFGVQTYRIKSGNSNDAFKLLTQSDGLLYLQVNRELDRETVSEYKLRIEALDGGQPPLSAELEVNVEIEDINDSRPQFDKSLYSVKLLQNTTIGSKILQVHATDKDINQNGQISYNLRESPNTLKLLNNRNLISNRFFEIDSKGCISLVNPLTNLPKSLTTYELIVIARDGGDIPLETSALVVLSIQRTGGSVYLPKINVLFLNDNNQPELNESARIGEIVARITVTDEDESEPTNKATNYKLDLDEVWSSVPSDLASSVSTNVSSAVSSSPSDEAYSRRQPTKFRLREIDQNTYLLIVSDRLDREEQESFDLRFTAYPAGRSAASMNGSQVLRLKLLLLDVNNKPPYFESKEPSIELNQYSDVGTLVYTFRALDRDLPATNRFAYALDAARSDRESLEWFELNGATGELRIKQLINCNLNKQPKLVVRVTDGLNEGESASLTVRLQSNNDHAPVLSQAFYNVSVSENALVGHCFLTLSAYDLDCGLNSSVTFSLLATNRADLPLTSRLSAFQLNQTSGELCIASKLDYEQRHFYELIVIAANPRQANSSSSSANSTSIVHIYVADANSHDPFFLTSQYKVNVHENIVPLMSNGLPAPILVVKAHDEDVSPEFNTILYSIIAGNDDSGFEIDERTGKLYLLKPLSSVRSVYQLTVSAEDAGGRRSRNQATVHVYVLNSGYQQEYLHFTTSVYNFNLVENALPGTRIGKLTVQITSSPTPDLQANHPVNMYNGQASSQAPSSSHLLDYRIYSGNEQAYFQLDSQSGDLVLTRNSSQLLSAFLDYEKRQTLLINVQCRLASANSEHSAFAFSQVNITLSNLNDHMPEFYNELSLVSLKENSRPSTVKPVFAVRAIDADMSGLFGRIRYHFKSLAADNFETSEQSGPFHLNKLTGEIFLTGELDYEQQAAYDLNLLSVDGGGRTNEMQLKVNLIDLSDCDPYFVNSDQQPIQTFNLSVSESLPIGELLHQFVSLDPDVNDQTFVYTIVAERKQLLNGSWSESQRSECFRLGLISGALRVNCVLDLEQVSAYELKLQVKDSGDNRGYLSVFLNLEDCNDSKPSFITGEYRFQLSEDSPVGSRIGQVTATDPDRGPNGTVQFELVKSFDETFRLDAKSGELFLAKPLDRECKDRYILKAQVSDLGEPVRLIGDQLATIVIDVLDVNDMRPVFLDPYSSVSSLIKAHCGQKASAKNSTIQLEHFQIPSDSPAATIVSNKIRAYDLDLAENGTIIYSIKRVQQLRNGQLVEHSDWRPFGIGSRDGIVQTAVTFDGQQNATFRLAIEAEDSKGLKAEQPKWIEIKLVGSNKQTAKVHSSSPATNRPDVEYVELEIERLRAGQSIGSFIDLRSYKPATSVDRQLLNGCDAFYLSSASDLVDQPPFTLNITGTTVNLVCLAEFVSSQYYLLNVFFKSNDLSSDCSLSLASDKVLISSSSEQHSKQAEQTALIKQGYQRMLTFELNLKQKATKDLPFDCLRKQLRNTDFGEELMQINLNLNQETTYEKSLDLYDFRRCSTIQGGQQLRLVAVQNEQSKLLNQLKLNGDLVLQLWPDSDALPYDQELLVNLQALGADPVGDSSPVSDSILLNLVFNKRKELNLNHLKVLARDGGEVLRFREDCCVSGEVIHQVLLNADLSASESGEVVRFKFLTTGSSQYELFRLDQNGLISLTKEFDYETQSSYELNVAIEVLADRKVVKQLEHSIKILIGDVNDEKPRFVNQMDIEFAENVPVGTLLVKLKATDRDEMDSNNLTYLLPDGYQHKKSFELNSKTGELRLKSSLDRERIASYRIPVIVFDYDYLHNDQAYVNLVLSDINDINPVFNSDHYSLEVPENLPINSLIYTFIASDDDESNQLTYELIACSAYSQLNADSPPASNNNPFRLDSRTGQLFTADRIDYELSAFYNLTVAVSDGQQSSTCSLLVEIKNYNDNTPKFDLQTYAIAIDLDKLNEQSGQDQQQYEITTVKASDADRNAKLYYSIELETKDGAYYTMNSTSGRLSINRQVLEQLLRRKLSTKRSEANQSENKQSIASDLDIRVIDPTDYNVLTAGATVRVQFTGSYLQRLADELSELKRETLKFSQYPLVFELSEQSLSRRLGEHLANSAAVVSEVRFELINQTAEFEAQFSLNGRTGEFSLRQPIRNRNYECFVLATSERYGQTLNLVQFTRIPMVHPASGDGELRKFSFELSLEENLEAGHSLVQLEERVNIYLRNHQFRLIYSSVNASWFNLDARTGRLSTARKFDYEKHPARFELIVLASVPNSYSNLMLFNLTIHLINTNDNAVVYNHPAIYVAINESLSKNSFVVRLGAIDLDTIRSGEQTNRLDAGTTYHIVEGNRDSAFKIVDNALYTNVVLDREIHSQYTLFIYTNEQQSPKMVKSRTNSISYLTVCIFVLDVNDMKPVFPSSNQEFSIIENAAGQLIGSLNTNDVDVWTGRLDSPTLTYQLVRDSNYEFNQRLFDINQFTGEIRLRNRIKLNSSLTSPNDQFIDYDSPLREFYFNVTANDTLHQAETRIKVSLKRGNIYQQMPIFRQETSYFEMAADSKECLAINCVLFQVQTLPFKLNGHSHGAIQTGGIHGANPPPAIPKIKTQFKLVGKANRYFFIDPNGFVYNNQTLPVTDSARSQLFRLIVQSYYAFENGRPINGLKSTQTLLIVAKKSFGGEKWPDKSDELRLPSNQSTVTVELEKCQNGDVIYRLPYSTSVRYELPADQPSFALKSRNQLIILRRPKRIETLLKIKATTGNRTDFVYLNIRIVSQKQATNQIFKRRLFSVQLDESTPVGQRLIDLKSNESSRSATFSVHTGNQLGHFKLDPSTGVLALSHRLNCKLVDQYTLIVLANDGSTRSFAVVRLQIAAYPHLTLPVLPLDHYQATLTENVPVGTRVAKITSGRNLTLDGFKFVLRRANQFGDQRLPFEFDHRTGYLIASSPVDYEQLFEQETENVLDLKLGIQFTNPNSYLKPFHNGSSSLVPSVYRVDRFQPIYPGLLNEVSVRIKVQSEDEFYPKFERGLYDFRLEIAPNETTSLLAVGQVHAEDADSGVDGVIVYSINSTVPSWTEDLFSLNANTGILTMNLSGNAANDNQQISNWLHSSNGYTSIIVSAKSPRRNSLSSMTVVDITIQSAASKPTAPKTQLETGSQSFDASRPASNGHKLNSKVQGNRNHLLPPAYESNEVAGHQLKPQQPPAVNKQQNSIARTVNESQYNGQRKSLISNNLIQVYGIVIGLLGLLLVLILFSVVLLFRICRFTSKTHGSTSSNGSIYNSKNQDYDPNCQLNKSLSCLIGNQHYNASLTPPSDSSAIVIGQHSNLKQADFMMNMALQRNSIIYQEQHKGGYLNGNQLNSNASLINDTGSNCNTSITILHSHENSDTKSDCLNSDRSIGQESSHGTRRAHSSALPVAKITNLQSRNLPLIDPQQLPFKEHRTSGQSNIASQNKLKNRPLPDIASPIDCSRNVNYPESKYSVYDEVREHPNAYYGNTTTGYLESSHNYEAISPTYDSGQVEFFQNWSPAYHPVTEILSSHLMANHKKSALKSANELKRSPVSTATITSTNRLN